MNIHIGLGCASLLTLANALPINTTPNPGFHNCGFNLSATCNDKMELFADGNRLATSDYWKVTTVVHIPPNTKVLQINCIDGWILGGILASSDNGLVTNGAWNCSSDNGTTWHPAHELWSNEMTMPEISSAAKWIWTNRPTWTHTQMRPHTTAICKIDLQTWQCCPPFTNSAPSTTPIPTPFPTTTTQAPSTPTPGFNLTATCDDKMKLFADGNLLATSSNWRNSSQVVIPANTQIIEIHCIDTGILGGILASSANGLITDGAWICSSDNGTTWSPAYKVGPNGNAVPDISPDAEWIWTGWIGDWTSKYTGQTHCNNCICKVILGAIDGAWSTWSSFSSCSATCGGATKSRSRTCSNPPPSNGGRPCPGLEEEVVNCGLSKCGSYETEMLIQLDTSTAFVTANLSSKQKENCTKEMKITMKKYKETEDIIKKLRFKKPFIRSTELTDRLGSDSRLFTALKQTITQVSTTWAPNGAAESLINVMSEKFQKWAKKGGGLSILETRSGYEKSEDGDLICSALLQYRRIDGKCNNLAVTDLGSAGIALRRFISNKYEDGESTPRGGITNSSLPSARVVSRKIHHANNPNPLTSKGYTLMAMQFGQFLDHDVTLTADMEMECCDPEILSNYPSVCFNIDITGDDFYSGKTTCHSFTRSVGIVSDTGIREQINGITAYIDASNVYGSDDVLAKNLRTLVNGRLKTHADGPMLPTRRQANLESKGPAQLDDDLVAGDMRAIEQPTLASIHSLFLNEHNRIADELRSRLSNILSNKNQSEQDEIIYQESRKLVGAEMQNIVYNEFLPIVLGQDELTKHNLQLSATTTYDEQIDPSIRNEFATVAFRFGHSLIAGMFNGNGGHRLKLTYFDESPEFVSGRSPNNNGRAWYSELTETSKQTSPAGDVFCTEDVTNFLFSNTRGGATNFGDDLAARNIQRGKDHGIPPYNEFRTFCGLSPLVDFHKKPKEITAQNWAKLKKTYNRVNDIDAWTGGLAETAPSDGLVGPTFACIIGKQFNFLKFGDRFFFNNDNGNGLKVKSRETIARRNLGDIICDNTDTTVLQTYVMLEEDAISNPQRKCSSRNSLDFDAITLDITDEARRLEPVIDGGWSEWSEFSLCNATCGDAAKSRTRTCTNPPPSNGDASCSGSEEEVVSCGFDLCDGDSCPVGVEYNDMCYISVDTPETWLDAKEDCKSRGGDLASIKNADVNSFVANLVGPRTWIGATDAETEGVWKWTNGDVVKWTNWGPKNPDNYLGNQHCATINYQTTGHWDDDGCTVEHPYICQINKDCPYADKYIDCPKWKNHCESGQWEHCMKENCPRTCKCKARTTITTTAIRMTTITTTTQTTTTSTTSTTAAAEVTATTTLTFSFTTDATATFTTGDFLIDGTCYVDDRGSRLLPHYSSSNTNTPEECKKTCIRGGYLYAGVQWGMECWCGNDRPPASKIQDSSQCNMNCTGDASQKCGSGLGMNIYKADTCVSMCSSIEGCSLVKNTLMTTLTKLAKEFFISFEYKATAYGGHYQSVIHFTQDGDGNDVGERIPAVWTHQGGRLHLIFSIDGYGNYVVNTEKYPAGQWHQAEFSQRLENGKYIYRVNINGKNVVEVENKDPRVFSNVKVYAADPWYNSLEGSIRNFYINNEAPNRCGGLVNETECKATNGESCVFPFKYGGKTYNVCDYWNSIFWCATSVKADGNYHNWGTCPEDGTCPLEGQTTTELPTTAALNTGLFSEPVKACLKYLNNDYFGGITLEECKEKCSSATSYICKSLDYEPSSLGCWLSEESKNTKPSAYTKPCHDGDDAIYLEHLIGQRN